MTTSNSYLPSTSSKNSELNLQFVGPAQSSFPSFMELAKNALDSNFPNWQTSQSLILPPIFTFKNADITQEELREGKEKAANRSDQPFDRRMKDIISDDAEYLVFKSILKLIQDGIQSPFIAVHGLNLDLLRYQMGEIFPRSKWENLQKLLEESFREQTLQLYPNDLEKRDILEKFFKEEIGSQVSKSEFRWDIIQRDIPKKLAQIGAPEIPKSIWVKLRNIIGDYFRESDFVLIGPKIGLIAIEVKSSFYTQKKHFAKDSRFLPEDYTSGLAQLNAFDTKFLKFLEDCTGIAWPEEMPVRKILCTPNLERKRLDGWMNGLDEECRAINNRFLDTDVIRWFKEDLENLDEDMGKPPLYRTLRNLLEMDWTKNDSAILRGGIDFSQSISENESEDIDPDLGKGTLNSAMEESIIDFRHDYFQGASEIDTSKSKSIDSAWEIFKIYGPIIAGLSCVTIQKTSVSLNKQKLSEMESIMKESSKIVNQDPLDRLEKMVSQNRSKRGFSDVEKLAASKRMALELGSIRNIDQPEFGSLDDLAMDVFEKYWPGWKNYENATSFMIPNIFRRKIPKMMINDHDQAINRLSENAEEIVYWAIDQLIKDEWGAPFLAIHGLDMDKLKFHMEKILSSFEPKMMEEYKNCFREYDFVLIGPKIGFVFIEVQSSTFSNRKHFSPKSIRLPENMVDGIKSLESVDIFGGLLQKIAAFQQKEPSPFCIPIRKILFTPNLDRRRYEMWFNNLDMTTKQMVMRQFFESRVEHWFKDDMGNLDGDIGKVPLYGKLKQMGQCGQGLPIEIYEYYVPIIVGLASATDFKNGDQAIRMDTEKFLMEGASGVGDLMDIGSISGNSQQLQHGEQSTTRISEFGLKPAKNLESISKKSIGMEIRHISNAVILTPDQMKTLNGPNRQLIIGAAGTGKTIILQEKAMQLLRKNESVLILTSKNYLSNYKKLIDGYGFENYKIGTWEDYKRMIFGVPKLAMAAISGSIFHFEKGMGIIDAIQECIRNSVEEIPGQIDQAFDWMITSDHVIIDDALDDFSMEHWSPNLVSILAIFAYSKLKFPGKTVWIGMDALRTDQFYWDPDSLYNMAILEMMYIDHGKSISEQKSDALFSVSILNQVMRCSENIFRRAYSSLMDEPKIDRLIRPILGHKIQGISVQIDMHRLSYAEAEKCLLENISDQLHQMIRLSSNDQSILLGNVAIIVDGWTPNGSNRFVVPNTQLKSGIIEYLKKSDLERSMNEMVGVFDWAEVSSQEWPIVIFGVCAPRNILETGRSEYRRYRGITRAMVKLVEICVGYDLDGKAG